MLETILIERTQLLQNALNCRRKENIAYCTGWFSVSTWHRWSYHRERRFRWGTASMISSCKTFSQFVIKRGRSQLIVSGAIPGLVVLVSKRKQAEQARASKPVKQHPSMPLHQLLPPSSCPVWVPVPTSFGNEQQHLNVSWLNPFLPNLLLGHDVLCRNTKLDEDRCFLFDGEYTTWTHTFARVLMATQ